MTTYDMVIQLCKIMNVSIADTFEVTFEQSFILEDGTKIKVSNITASKRR